MRQEHMARLSRPQTGINDPIYVLNKFLYRDMEHAIKQHAKGDMLDIGCGNKPYSPFFDGVVSSYTGCDIVQSDRNLVDILCPATEIPLPDNSKDTVFSTQVIEHVAEHQKMLGEAFRILKPGGHIIVSGPMAWEHHEEPYDFFRFTKYGFRHVFEKAGFSDIEIIPNGGKWVLVGQLFHNSLRSSFVGKKSVKSKILKGLYFIFRIKWIINLFFVWLDNFDKDYSSTANFIVLAKKPQ